MADLNIQLYNQDGDNLMPKTLGSIVTYQSTREGALSSDNVQDAIRELEDLINGVDGKVNLNTQEIEKLKLLVDTIKNTANENKDNISSLTSRMDDAELAIEIVDDRLTDESEKINQNIQSISRIDNEVKQNTLAIEEVKNSIPGAIDEKLVDIKANISEISEKVDGIEINVTSLQDNVSDIDQRTGTNERNILELQNHASNLDIHVTRPEMDKWNGYDARISKNENEIAKIGASIGSMDRHFFVENEEELEQLKAEGNLRTGDLIHKLDTRQTFMYHSRGPEPGDDELILVSDFSFVGEHTHDYLKDVELEVNTSGDISTHSYQLKFTDGKGGTKNVDLKPLLGVTYSIIE